MSNTDPLQKVFRGLNPEGYDFESKMNEAIQSMVETGDHHSVYQLSSNIAPFMMVRLSSDKEDLELHGYYEIWSTESIGGNNGN